MQLNMKKEYRAELTVLRRNARLLNATAKQTHRMYVAELSKLLRERDRAIKRLTRDIERIERRRKILEGRLS